MTGIQGLSQGKPGQIHKPPNDNQAETSHAKQQQTGVKGQAKGPNNQNLPLAKETSSAPV